MSVAAYADDADGHLLYIGATRDIEGRMYHMLHPCNRGKRPNGDLQRRMDSYAVTEYPTRADAFAAERAAIAAELPELNRQSKPKRAAA